MMRIILASRSPRRQELLARVSNDFVVIPSDVEESTQGDPCERVMSSARNKARAVDRCNESIVLGADTLVVLDGVILGKPTSRDEAAQMLRLLSGRTHRVLTGMYLWDAGSGRDRMCCCETTVRFRDIEDAELEWYLDSGEYSDKAGGYGIQGRAAVFVEEIVGEYTNVMGLPLCRLSRLLRELAVDRQPLVKRSSDQQQRRSSVG